MARLSRYSRWDGTQAVPDLDADQLLSALSDDLLADGDLWNALRRLFQRGAQDPQGGRMPGLQDLLKRLKQERQQRLEQYDMGSVLDDIKKQLADILKTERAGIERDVPPGAVWDQAILRAIESCRAFVLILSTKANDSPFVNNEVNRAFAQRKAIFTFRVEDVLPSGYLEFYLARHHWTDGFPPPLDAKIDRLAAALNTASAPAPSTSAQRPGTISTQHDRHDECLERQGSYRSVSATAAASCRKR